MADILLSLPDLLEYIGDGKRCLLEGEQVLIAKHIICCGVRERLKARVSVFALCLQTSSLTGKPHELSAVFSKDNENSLKYSFEIVCSCKAGNSHRCKHCIAVLMFLNRTSLQDLEDLSCTDMKQAWGKTKRMAQEMYEPCLMEQLCHVKKREKITISLNVEQEIQKALMDSAPHSAIVLHRKGRKSGCDLLRNIASTCEVNLTTCVGHEIAKKLISSAMLKNQHLEDCSARDKELLKDLNTPSRDYYNCNIAVSLERSVSISEATKSQLGENWKNERMKRITGSKCYSLYTFQAKSSTWLDKVSNHIKSFDFKGNKMTRHGILNEPKAIQKYTEDTNRSVKLFGLLINPLVPYLAYSPDGIVFENGEPTILLEVKCPVMGKNKPIFDAALKGEVKCLNYVNETFQLKERHQYFGQIQLGLILLNLKVAHLLLYSSCDNSVLVVPVARNDNFIKNLLDKMRSVFFNHILPYFVSKDN